jgi:hypothetical protein
MALNRFCNYATLRFKQFTYMKRFSTLLPGVFLLFAFAIPADVKLQYTFKKGDLYEFNQTSNQSIRQTLPGMGDMTTEVTTSGSLTFKVIEVIPTGARIEIAYTRLKIDTKGPMTISMDSEGNATEMPNNIVKAMMNKPFHFVMTSQGAIEKIENIENLYSGLGSIGLDETQLAATKQMFQQTLSASSLKGNLEAAMISYPQNKIKTGESWKNKSGVAVNFPMQSENTWLLKSLDGTIASIDSDGVMTSTDTTNVMSLPNGIKAKTNLSGKQATKSKVNTKNGWPTETKVLSEIKGTMTLLAGGVLPSDMEVPMEIVTESTFLIVKK